MLFNIPESGKNKKNWKPKTKDPLAYGKLTWFSQKDFVGYDMSFGSFKEKGLVYIPEYCNHNKNCNIHVDFHPCKSATPTVAGETHIMEYAATNNLIVLFPFVTDCYDTETHVSKATNDDFATN
jgi:hypothetical protein